MANTLQKVPAGVLSALDLKTLGENPRQWPDTVSPTVEILDHYALNLLDTFEAADNVSATGGNVVATVPDGQIWRVFAASAVLVTGTGLVAADGLVVALGVSTGPAKPTTYFSEVHTQPFAAGTAAALRVYAPWAGRPFLLGPGGRILAVNGATYGANVQISVEVGFNRLT